MNSDGKLRLCGFYRPPGAGPYGWLLPEAEAGGEATFTSYLRDALTMERGLFDAMFLQDSAAIGGGSADKIDAGDTSVEGRAGGTKMDPMTLLPAIAALTTHLGLAGTATTTYNEPYHIARKFATLDIISGGRGGWNVVTSQVKEESQNFGLDSHPDHGNRYERAEEFCDVVTGLWDSWDPGYLLVDKESGRYFDMSKVRVLNHRGRYFTVRGPLNAPPSPQGRPVIFQAGSSEPGRQLAARTADAVFTAAPDLEAAKVFHDDLKGRLAQFGRGRDDLKILPGVMPFVAETDEAANALYRRQCDAVPADAAVELLNNIAGGLDLRQYDPNGPLPELPVNHTGAIARQHLLTDLARRENLSIVELGRFYATAAGHRVLVGSPTTVADYMQSWFEAEACDGFVILFPYMPGGVEDFVNLVVPELQRRGIFRSEYEGKTLRQNLGLPLPVSAYTPI